MAKTNAQRQNEYRERKKARQARAGDSNFLERERTRQKNYYLPIRKLANEEHKIRKGAVKQRVRRCRISQKRNEEQVESERNVSAVSESDQSTTSAASEFSPLSVQMNFPKRRCTSKKRRKKHLEEQCYELKKARSQVTVEKKKNAALRKKLERMKKNRKQKETVIDPNTSNATTPRFQVNTDLRRHGMNPSSIPRGIHTQLVYGNVISSEIAIANAEERNRKQGIRNLISGKILKKYRMGKLVSKITGTNRNKLSKVSSKLLITKPKKRQEDVELKNLVKDFYCRDDNSTTMPGKRDSKKVKSKSIQKKKSERLLK